MAIFVVEPDHAATYEVARVLGAASYRKLVFYNSGLAWDTQKRIRSELLLTSIHFPAPRPNGLASAAHTAYLHPTLPRILLTDTPTDEWFFVPKAMAFLWCSPSTRTNCWIRLGD